MGKGVIEKYWVAALASSRANLELAKLIYCQWAHETADFTSDLCLTYNNLAGVTQEKENELPQPDGSFYYMKFADVDAFATYFGRFIRLFDGAAEATTITEYATALKDGGYFGDTLENYIDGMTAAYEQAFEA